MPKFCPLAVRESCVKKTPDPGDRNFLFALNDKAGLSPCSYPFPNRQKFYSKFEMLSTTFRHRAGTVGGCGGGVAKSVVDN
jgi:hypothetical protein